MYVFPGKSKAKNMNKERETETWKYDKNLYKGCFRKELEGGKGKEII